MVSDMFSSQDSRSKTEMVPDIFRSQDSRYKCYIKKNEGQK